MADECIRVCAVRVEASADGTAVEYIDVGPAWIAPKRHWNVRYPVRRMLDAGDVFDAIVDGEHIAIAAKIGRIEAPERSWRRPVIAWPWIPVTERLPEANVEVLAWDGEQRYIAERCDNAMLCGLARVEGFNHLHDVAEEQDAGPATHWQPLPEPPKE